MCDARQIFVGFPDGALLLGPEFADALEHLEITSRERTMRRFEAGFTLIELMTVMGIIAVLAALAIPAYNNYRINTAESACLAETKNYASFAVTEIYENSVPAPATVGACASIDTATDLDTDITGTPSAPGVRTTTCDMNSASCALD